jgi:hypothetical protein
MPGGCGRTVPEARGRVRRAQPRAFLARSRRVIGSAYCKVFPRGSAYSSRATSKSSLGCVGVQVASNCRVADQQFKINPLWTVDSAGLETAKNVIEKLASRS